MPHGKKPDHMPLLAPGRHLVTMSDVRRLFVDPFTDSAKRPVLFQSLEEFIHILVEASVACDVWLDGSFLTDKSEPDDLDLAVIVSHEAGENLSDYQRGLVAEIDEDMHPDDRGGLDTFAFVRLPKDSPLYGDELADSAHTWHEQWGQQHDGQWLKGFAVLKLGETDVGLRICS